MKIGDHTLAAAAALALVASSCASSPLDGGLSSREGPDPIDALIGEAIGSLEQQDFGTAASLLQAIGLRGQAYDRMDEVLYWLGRARAGQGELERAERCFRLLIGHYPRSTLRFADLDAERARVLAELDRLAAPVASDESTVAATEPPGRQGPLVSNVFLETNVRQALSDVSAQTGVRIVPDPLVQGLVTAEFVDTPLDDALEQILAPLGFVLRKYPDYYLVGAPKEESPAFMRLTETRRYRPENIDAGDVLELLPRFLSSSLKVDQATNVITLTAAPDLLERFEADLALIDQPIPQILIEARVVEMDQEVRRALGIEWSVSDQHGFTSLTATRVPPLARFDPALQLDYLRVTGSSDIRATLRALDSKGVVHVRANPRVATLSGQEATIRIGREAFFSLLQGSAAFPFITLEKIQTGITLRITPLVGASHHITTLLHTEVSDVTGTGVDDLPVISVRTVDTRIRVASGETIAVGGLVLESTTNERQGIPGLGRLPFLGALFSDEARKKEDVEVVVFVTPYVLFEPEIFLTL